MNLFKKSAAVVALLTLVSGLFSTGTNAYSQAQIEAANYLASQGIIVDHTGNPAGYNLDQNVLRQEIAAVARGIAGLDKATTFQGYFKDVTQTTPNNWAWASVEPLRANGLIAANEYFNPERNISKAEAIGMVVKAAFGNEYAYDASLSTSWQQQVVAFAVSKGIIASFSDYDTAATRGFIFEGGANAKQAVDGGSSNSDLCDILSALGIPCDDGKDNPSTDDKTPPVVGVGELGVSLNPKSPVSGTQIPSVGTILFGRVDFTAGSSDIAVNTVEVKSLGLAAVPTSTRIWLEKDGRRLSGRAAFTSDRTAIISFAPAYVVRAGTTATLDLYAELDTVTGNDFQFTGTATDTSAAKVSGSFTTAALRTATYVVAPVEFTAAGTDSTYNQGDEYVELGNFRLANMDPSSETRDVLFQSVTLRNNGRGDLLDLSDIYVERDGQRVSTSTEVTGKDVTFVLNDTVRDGATGLYYIKAKVLNVQSVDGDTYEFNLRNTTDLSAVEVLNGFRSTVYSDYAAVPKETKSVTLKKYQVNGANIQFARSNSVDLSRTAAPGSQDVTLLQGTITAKSAITLEDLALDYNINNSGLKSDSPAKLFNVVYLKIGSSTFTWTPVLTDGIAGTANFLGLAQISGTADIRIYANIKDNISPDEPTFTFNSLKGGDFGLIEYVASQNEVKNTDYVGSIAGVAVNIGATGLNIARVDGLGNEKITPGSNDVLVSGVNLTINQGNNVRVSGATYGVTFNDIGGGDLHNNAFATLYVNGQAKSTQTIKETAVPGVFEDVKFSGFSEVVSSSTPLKLEVRVSFTENLKNDDEFSLKLNGVNAVDTVSSNPVTPGSYPNAATLTFAKPMGIVSASDNNPSKSLFLAGSQNNEIFAFRVQAKNDDIKLNDLTFKGADLSNFSNFRLKTPNGTLVSASTASDTSVTFKSINLNEVVRADNTVTFYIVADANTNTNLDGIWIGFDDVGINQLRGTNGKLEALDGVVATIKSKDHAIYENKAVIAKASKSSSDPRTGGLRFTVTASGKNSVTLTDAVVDVLSNYDGSVVTIYRGSVNSANIVAEGISDPGFAPLAKGTVTWNPGSFTTNNTVDAGSTNTYIVVINDAIYNGGGTPDWSISLSDLEITQGVLAITYSIIDYQNLGDLPLTETR